MPKPFSSDAERRAAFARMSGKGYNAFNRDASVRAVNTLPDTPSNRKEWANDTRRIDLEGVDTPIVKGELPKKETKTEQPKEYRYAMYNRPVWSGMNLSQHYDIDLKKEDPAIGENRKYHNRDAHSIIITDKPLSADEIKNLELVDIAADNKERAHKADLVKYVNSLDGVSDNGKNALIGLVDKGSYVKNKADVDKYAKKFMSQGKRKEKHENDEHEQNTEKHSKEKLSRAGEGHHEISDSRVNPLTDIEDFIINYYTAYRGQGHKSYANIVKMEHDGKQSSLYIHKQPPQDMKDIRDEIGNRGGLVFMRDRNEFGIIPDTQNTPSIHPSNYSKVAYVVPMSDAVESNINWTNPDAVRKFIGDHKDDYIEKVSRLKVVQRGTHILSLDELLDTKPRQPKKVAVEDIKKRTDELNTVNKDHFNIEVARKNIYVDYDTPHDPELIGVHGKKIDGHKPVDVAYKKGIGAKSTKEPPNYREDGKAIHFTINAKKSNDQIIKVQQEMEKETKKQKQTGK